MESTATPAEQIAGDLALAAAQGLPAPSAGQVAAAYDVPPATVTAALQRLAPAHGASELLAAAAMCRRLDAIAGDHPIEPIDVPGLGRLTSAGDGARLAAEQFLTAARRPLSPADSRYMSARARELITIGREAAAARGVPVGFAWTRNPAADSFPAAVGAGLTAAGRGGAARAGRPAQSAARPVRMAP